MKTLLDSSVLVVAHWDGHPHFAAAHRWLDRAAGGEFEWVVAAHSLAETYATLTAMPPPARIKPMEVAQILEANVLRHARVVTLPPAECFGVVRQLADAGLSGGIIYDALLLHTARVAQVERLVTANLRDFQRLPPVPRLRIVGI